MSDTPTISTGFGSEFKKLVPGLLLTIIVAFGTSWWNSQLTQNELRFRLDRLEEKQKEALATTADAAKTAQGNAIRMAEMGVIQNNVIEQVREIRAEHDRLVRNK